MHPVAPNDGDGIPGVNPEELVGKLIVVEGADGSGRSTHAATPSATPRGGPSAFAPIYSRSFAARGTAFSSVTSINSRPSRSTTAEPASTEAFGAAIAP